MGGVSTPLPSQQDLSIFFNSRVMLVLERGLMSLCHMCDPNMHDPTTPKTWGLHPCLPPVRLCPAEGTVDAEVQHPKGLLEAGEKMKGMKSEPDRAWGAGDMKGCRVGSSGPGASQLTHQ